MKKPDLDATTFIGQKLRRVSKRDHTWNFDFGRSMNVTTEASWRFVNPDGIFVTSDDHGQLFGLSEPVDAAARVLSQLKGMPIIAGSFHDLTGDLRVNFGQDVYLEFLQISSGYESWSMGLPGEDWICIGGGQLA